MERENKPKKYQNQHIFEYLKNILTDKDNGLYLKHVEDDDFNSFPNLVIMRYLSMCNDTNVRNLILKNQLLLERLDKLGHSYSYKWYIENVPKQKSSFIKYVK